MFAYKIVVLGDFGVGKTSLIRRFVSNSFDEDYLSSIGVSMSKKQHNVDGIESTMIIWDTEGRTEHSPVLKQYLLGAKAFVIVADLTREETLEALSEHIHMCRETLPFTPIYIALNKCDLEHKEISLPDLYALSQEIKQIYKTSAKSGNEVDTIFSQINLNVVGLENA